MPPRLVTYLQLSNAMLLVGSTVVVSKLIVLPVFIASALRFAVALPVFLLLMRARRTAWPRPDRHDALLLLFQAACGSVGYTCLLVLGMRTATAADAAVISGALPAMAALFGWLFLREHSGARLSLAVALSSLGVLALQTQAGAQGGWSGRWLLLGAVACEAVFILLNRRPRQPLPALPQSMAMCALGLLLSLPGALWQARGMTAWPLPAVMGCIYYGLLPTAAGFLLWYAGCARVKAAEAALFTALAPVSAALLGVGLLGETLSAGQLAGLACVLAAIFVAARGRE